MREIKFRAWDKADKVMRVAEEIDFVNKTGGLIVRYEREDLDMIEINPSDHVLMQFTGLLDCNGVEVFEGDIVEVDDRGQMKRGLVEYFDVGFSCLTPSTGAEVAFRLDLFSIAVGEVVGNVHEHPELLATEVKDD